MVVSVSDADKQVNIKRIDVSSEKNNHITFEDYNRDGYKDFSIWHLDEGMGTYKIYRLFIFSPADEKFKEIKPTCGNDFVNVRVEGHVLINMIYDDNTPKSCSIPLRSISDDAQKATANPADLQAQIKLLEQQLTDLKKSVLLVSAPEGMALTSGQHLQVSAGQNLIATAGKNADVSVVKNLFIGVGNALSVFVRKLGIKLIANQGPVQVQAQNDLMELIARGELSLTSTEDEIHITAKKKVTINGGGSYITLDANGIESATQGEYRTKAGHYGRKDKANEPKDFPNVAPETTEPSSNFSFS